jgi:hypothetical protein
VTIHRALASDSLDSIQVGPMPVARFDRVPLARSVLEPSTPLGWIGTVLGVVRPVLGLDHAEAALR